MSAILDERSLAKTLWSLERARLAGVKVSQPEVAAALTWVASRQGQPGSYAQALFAPKVEDVEARNGTPTFEDNSMSRVGVIHILGEEAARAMELWGVRSGWDREQVHSALKRFRGAGSRFCCYRCSVAWWRALAAARVSDWETVLAAAVQWVEESMSGNGRPHGFPYYYLLLALSEMSIPEVERLRRQLKPTAERSLRGLEAEDDRAFFRRRAAEWAAG